MPPSFLPCKSPCPKTPPVTRPCALMRCVCDARGASMRPAPFLPSMRTPWSKICMHHAVPLTPAGSSPGGPIHLPFNQIDRTPHTQPVTVHKKSPVVKTTSSSGTPSPQQTFRPLHRRERASPPEVAVLLADQVLVMRRHPRHFTTPPWRRHHRHSAVSWRRS